MDRPLAAGWVCAVCGEHVDIATPFAWRCPKATDTDRHHALQLVQAIAPLRGGDDPNPFVAFRRYLAWDSFAAAAGMTESARTALVTQVDAAVAVVAGVGFHVTPFARADRLSDALGFGIDGGVWVKDETGQVAGSHKPRHLFTILLHLLTAEATGLASWSTLPIGLRWRSPRAATPRLPRPPWLQPLAGRFGCSCHPAPIPWCWRCSRDLRADIVECPRRPADPPGDPCIHRFREAVAGGAMPFTVQGTENAWCLDGGRTIGWEMARQFEDHVPGPPLDRVFVQVGAGTFAASTIGGIRMSGVTPRLHAVQTDSCAPLARAWEQAQRLGGPATAAAHWAECMWPWEHVGDSAADGILDDETYDWIPVLRAMGDSDGTPIVVTEAQVLQANDLGRRVDRDQRLAHRYGGSGRSTRSIWRCRPGRARRCDLQRGAPLSVESDVVETAVGNVVHEAADVVLVANEGAVEQAIDALANIGVRIREAFQGPPRLDTALGLELGLEGSLVDRLQAAIRVVDQQDLACAEQALREHQRANDVVGDDAAGIADDVRVAVGEAQHLEDVHAAVHTSNDRQPAARGQGQIAVGELTHIGIVVGQQLVDVRLELCIGHWCLGSLTDLTVWSRVDGSVAACPTPLVPWRSTPVSIPAATCSTGC